MENRTTIEGILAAAKEPAFRRAATARILLRQDLVERHRELEQALATVPTLSLDTSERDELADQLLAVEAEMEAEEIPFRFAAVGHRRWSDLMADHPPTRAQKADYPALDFNPDTFPAAAMAASCSEPQMTMEEALALEQVLDEAQYGQLWAACLDANIGGGARPKSVLAGTIRNMRSGSATTRVSEESLDQSSSGE